MIVSTIGDNDINGSNIKNNFDSQYIFLNQIWCGECN